MSVLRVMAAEMDDRQLRHALTGYYEGLVKFAQETAAGNVRGVDLSVGRVTALGKIAMARQNLDWLERYVIEYHRAKEAP